MGDRPYKEAKAYAIAGDYMFLWQYIFGNYRIIDASFYQAFLKLQQKFVLEPIYSIIPETDGERYIWRYKFQNHIYARSYWAPVTDENKKRGVVFWARNASHKPELLPILLDIYDSIVKLDTLPIQDEEFSQIDRYLVMANMFQYYQMYKERQISLEYEPNASFIKGIGKQYLFHTTPYYIEQNNRYIKAIDDAKAAIENNKKLAKDFESKPHAKAALYWAGVEAYRAEVVKLIPYHVTMDFNDFCESREIEQFTKYYNEYLIWSQSARSSFAGFSKHRKRQYEIVIEGFIDVPHYAAKYVCGKKFDRYSWWERIHLSQGDKSEELHKIIRNIMGALEARDALEHNLINQPTTEDNLTNKE
ncbi:MAG: hypothetical protein LBO72_02070 [Helicobacteraceae bacterium]|nr:hypothetical protein [Helicobacteraceae bacterium]